MRSITITYKYLSVIFFLTSFLIGCSQETKKDNNYSFGWETSSPEAEGINKLVIDSVHSEIQNGDYGLIDHFLLIRNGKIVADYHYSQDYEMISKNYDTTRHQYNYDHPDWHPYYEYSDLHSLQSVTKTITSILLGIAIDEGFVTHLDSAIIPFFSDYDLDLSDDRKKSITLRNLLTMQSGILWDESSSYADNSENNCTIMELSDDWIQYVLNRPMDTIPGTRFVYNSGVSVLIGKIMRITTGKKIDKWAEEKLFEPLGITEYYWKKTPKGEVDTEGGLYLKPQDLAKIGYMTQQKGKWENQQIVSEDWINKSIQPAVKLNDRIGYGYQWWIVHDKGEILAYNMQGYGGQIVSIFPIEDVVLVFNGWNIHGEATKRANRIFVERILPTIH